jgi:hypothetical protein
MKVRRTTTASRGKRDASARMPRGKLTRGTSAAATSRLEAAAKKHSEKSSAHELRVGRAERNTLRTRLAQPRASVARFVKKQAAFTVFQKEWDELVKHDGRPNPAVLRSKEGRKALVALMQRHRSLFESAYVGADVDARQMLRAVRSILSPALEKMLPLDFGNVLLIPPFAEPPPTPIEFELTPPYSSSDHHKSSTAVGTADALASAQDGFVSARAGSALDGDGYATATVGDTVSVPAGFTRLRITAATASLSYDVLAGGLANVSGAGCHIVLELTDVNGTVQRESDLVARVFAPVLWFAEKTGSASFQITRTLTIPGEGGDILVRAGVQALAWTVGLLGACSADAEATLDRISVEALP